MTSNTDVERSSSPRKLAVRFATGTPDGKLGSATWGIWKSQARKDDIYLAARGIGHQLRCSLHESGYCYLGFTRLEFDRMAAEGRAPPRREWVQWQRTPTPECGFSVAVEILLPPGPLSNGASQLDGKPTWIIGAPAPGQGVIVSVVYSRVPKGELSLEPGTRELGHCQLSTGEYVAVFASLVDFDYAALVRENEPALNASINRIVPADSEHVGQPLRAFLVMGKEDGKPLRLVDASVTITHNVQ